MRRRPLAPLLLAFAATACSGPSSYYAWGSYNEALYAHYHAPQDARGLDRGAQDHHPRGRAGRRAGCRPGIYAEYGYALFEEGDTRNAVVYFKKEQDLWPESRFLMEKMIRNAEQRGRQPQPPAVGPAGALERS